MSNINSIMQEVLPVVKGKVEKNKHVLGIVASVVFMGAGAYFTWKAGKNHDAVMNEVTADIQEVRETKPAEVVDTEGKPVENKALQEYRMNLAKVYLKSGWKLCKLYGPVAVCDGMSLLSGFTAYDTLNGRLKSALENCALLGKGLQSYRRNVVDTLGAEADREFMHGIKQTTIEVPDVDKNGEVKLDKNGNPKMRKQTIDYMDEGHDGYSPYARMFNRYNCPAEFMVNSDGTADKFYNVQIIKKKQQYWNDMIRARKNHVVVLNEVYTDLGYQPTKAGAIAGWHWDEHNPTGDNFIDFGIYDFNRGNIDDKASFINQETEWAILDFNVEGNVVQYM